MTDDTTRKPLGQVASEAFDSVPCRAPRDMACEVMAKAVEAAVLEEITRSGNKIVPVEPTDHMICATNQCNGLHEAWEQMLEAAPEYKPTA